MLQSKKLALEVEKQKAIPADWSFFDLSSYISFISEHKTLLTSITTVFFIFCSYQLVTCYFQNNNKINTIQLTAIENLNTNNQELIVAQTTAVVPQLLTHEYITQNNEFATENISIIDKILLVIERLKHAVVVITTRTNHAFMIQNQINIEHVARMDAQQVQVVNLMRQGDSQQRVITDILTYLEQNQNN